MMQKFFLVSVFLMIIMYSCNTSPQGVATDERPTRGSIKIGVDEAYQKLAEAEIMVFESIYKLANINPVYASEDSILRLFLNDSLRLMITSRQINENESAYLSERSIVVRTTKIAYDALAFVVNRSNPDTLIKYNALRDIFLGDLNNWKQLDPSSPLNDIRIIFDNQGSSSVRLIMNKFGLSGQLPAYVYSAGSNPAVIDYVESNPNAIGVISVNWISDIDDSITHSFLSRVKVIGITSDIFSEGTEYFRPHPAYIADKSYPFTREVYAISRETFAGLGTGFISFVAGETGQRILLKMGMLPATFPIRLIRIN